MNRRATIGFDRRLDLEWLDAAAAQAQAGADPEEMRSSLSTVLAESQNGEGAPSARKKTVTVLNHIWGQAEGVAEDLRQHALAEMELAPPEERLALHWAMMAGRYPVFTDLAAISGRLLVLQDELTLAQLTRRMVDLWGERSTLERAVQRIVRSMIQWGVLKDTPTLGRYEVARSSRPIGPRASTLLIHALLVDAEGAALPIDQLIGHSALFPFRISIGSADLRAAPQFNVHRQGLDMDVVELGDSRV